MNHILLDAIGGIRDEHIAECAVVTPICIKRRPVKKILLVAALVALLAIVLTGVAAATAKRGPLYEWLQTLRGISEDKTVAATVNGEPIYQSAIEVTRNQAQLSLENGRAAMETAGLTEEQKAEFLRDLEEQANRTDREILDERIREKVVYQEALQQGLEADINEACKLSDASYYALKEAAAAPDANENILSTWQIICDFMDVNDLTEEEYLQQCASVYQQGMTKDNLYEAFCENYNGSTPDTAWEAYVDDLVANADIVYH